MAIVQSYITKFGGRLTVSSTEKNSGGCAVPRNKGLTFSRGEYIFFMDSDDVLIKNALEGLYVLAKNYEAEVVYCERHFTMNLDGTNRQLYEQNANELIDKPTFAAENLTERVNYILQKEIWGYTWRKLVQRNFLNNNEIFFPNVSGCEDYLWTLMLFFHAKKFLHVPNAFLVYRRSEGSLVRKERSPQENINFWISTVIDGIKDLDKILGRLDFFQKDIQCRYVILEYVVNKIFNIFLGCSFQLPQFAVYEAIRQKFGDRLGEQDILVPALCSLLNSYQKFTWINQQKFQEFVTTANKKIAELEEQLKVK